MEYLDVVLCWILAQFVYCMCLTIC